MEGSQIKRDMFFRFAVQCGKWFLRHNAILKTDFRETHSCKVWETRIHWGCIRLSVTNVCSLDVKPYSWIALEGWVFVYTHKWEQTSRWTV